MTLGIGGGVGRGAFIGDVLKVKKASNSQVIRLLY